jgi:uncharacterized membrane protein
MTPLFTNDAVAFGILMTVLAVVFVTSSSDKMPWKGFYRYVPPILLCYFIPALLNYPFGIISPEWFNDSLFTFLETKGLDADALGLSSMSFDAICTTLKANGITENEYSAFTDKSKLYFVASRYLLPASLILLCLSIDFKGLINLGSKSLIMFFAATLGIILGGPIAVLLVVNIFPDIIPVEGDQLWRGLSTVAGSWIGGGANQTAMREIFEVSDNLFGSMIVVDVVCANIWMGFLLYGANMTKKVDKWLKADASMIEDLKNRVEDYRASVERIPTAKDLYVLGAIAFGGVALSHFGADVIVPIMERFKVQLEAVRLNSLLSGFFWLIVISTTFGLILSFTKARTLDGVGASRWGSVFIYILVTTIGMQMNLGEIWQNLGLFVIGIVWMLVHVTILLITAKIIKAPFFFVAVGSQANVGGAASAPVVAAAFSPALASVGALMAVLGYAMGTYGAILCAYLMQAVSG